MSLTKIGSIGINTGIQFAGVTTIATLNASDNVLSVGGTVNFVSDVSIGGTVSIAGTLTYEDVTNVDAVGLVTARNGIVVGSGITLSKDGDGFFTGIITATSYAGDGSALTGIDATQIVTGNTSVQTVDTGSDGHVKVNTEGSERARIDSTGRVRIGCTAQPSPTVSGAQFDAGGKTLRISEGGGTSSTTGSSVQITGGGGNTSVGAAAAMGAVLTLVNCNNTDNNQTSIDFVASTELSTSKVIGKNDSHSSRNGSLIFATSSGAAPAERVRIDSSGRLLLGTTTEGSAGADEFTINTASGHGGMTIRNDTSSNGNIWFSDGTSGAAEYAGYVQYAHNDDHMVFGTGGSERMRITSDGRVSIGGMAPDSGVNLHIESSGETNMILEGSSSTVGGYLMLKNKNNTANSSMSIQFLDASGQGVSEINGVAMSDANNQGYLALKTRPNGGSMTERFRVSDIGVIEKSQQANVRTFEFAFAGGVGGSTTTQAIATLTNTSGSTMAIAHIDYVSNYGIANDYIYCGIWACSTRRKNSNTGWQAESNQVANGGSGSAGPVVIGWLNGELQFTCTAFMGYTIHVQLTVYNATTTINAL